jgi:hypothetical protein
VVIRSSLPTHFLDVSNPNSDSETQQAATLALANNNSHKMMFGKTSILVAAVLSFGLAGAS